MIAVVTGWVYAAISWDPAIRGWLIVATSVVILMGSVYLLLTTNVGSRLGLLLSFAGLFGWMTLFGIFWWIYGIGPIGTIPEWRVQEINVGDLSVAELDEAQDLLSADELADLRVEMASDESVADQFDPAVSPSMGDVATVAPDLIDELEVGGDWEVVSAAEVGEAQAAADEALTGDSGVFSETSEYLLLDGFELGGKPERESDSVVDRLTNKLTNSLRLTHPPHYAIVQVQGVVPQETLPGEAPPIPVADEDQPVVSAILIRDIGNRRVPPAIVTVVMAFLFALTCWRLHVRDLRLAEAQASPTGS